MLPALDAASGDAHGDGQAVGSPAGRLRSVYQAVHKATGDQNRVPREESQNTSEHGVEAGRVGADRRG